MWLNAFDFKVGAKPFIEVVDLFGCEVSFAEWASRVLDGPLLNTFDVEVVADVARQNDHLRLLWNELDHANHTLFVLSENFRVE